MARFLKPLVRSGGYYPSRRWTPLVYPGGYTTANGGEEPAPQPIEKTITGNPIHILDALAKPAQALSVKLEPVQDLHGYSYPWPAGGGVNLLDPAKCSVIGPSGTYGLTVTHDQATAIWTISGTPTLQNASLAFNFCTYSDFSLSGKGYQVQAFPISGTPIKNLYGFRNEAESRIAIIIDTVANPTVNMTFKVSVAATAQTAWSPYSNICPISGWTGCNVTRTGKNLVSKISDGRTNSSVTYTPNQNGGIQVSCSSTSHSKSYSTTNALAKTFILNPGTYTLSASIQGTAISLFVAFLPTGRSRFVTRSTPSQVFTLAEKTEVYIAISVEANGTSDETIYPMLEFGSTASAYEPFGQVYPITFPSEAGTVYGGTLDVTTGKLTVDRAMVTFDGSTDETWTYSSYYAKTNTAVFYTSVLTDAYYPDWDYRGYTINLFPNATRNYLYNNDVECMGFTGTAGVSASPTVRIFKTRASNETEFRSFLNNNPIQFVYELATPQTYQFTPTEVTLLLGENNIWSDGEMALTYLADGNASDEEALNP